MAVTPSTTLITTTQAVVTAGFDAVTTSNAVQHGLDAVGSINLALMKLCEAKRTLNLISAVLDANDPQAGNIANVLASLS